MKHGRANETDVGGFEVNVNTVTFSFFSYLFYLYKY